MTFGSRTPRADMKYGRVGSPFSDPALIPSEHATSSASDYYEEVEAVPAEEAIGYDEPITIDLRD